MLSFYGCTEKLKRRSHVGSDPKLEAEVIFL